nr:PREDICTED: kremen protein 2-like [Latimeria chalumnae]|eukprot:XP_006012226.2 PREDICTED: kremen protein 2-like [Latimeria chalumnae]
MVLLKAMVLLLEAFLQISLTLQRQGLPECFKVNGADYRGMQNETSVVGGRPCLFWNQTHIHTYNTAKYPNGEWGLGSHNYCRNPDGDVQPWCYVSETEEGIYWKYCDIPSCHMPGYIGCFLDSGNPPALSGSSGTSTKLTVQACIRFCRKKGYKYAGLEAGYACFCGNDVDMSKNEQVSTVECDQVCFGKSNELCGGDGRIGIYGAWVVYTATATFVVILAVTVYHLRKRTCLFVQRKTTAGVLVIKSPRGRCQCLGGEAWSVAYRHTKVVICSKDKGEDDSSDCSCLCENYNNLSASSQSSLKPLISQI